VTRGSDPLICNGIPHSAPAGVRVRNYQSDGVVPFKGTRRKQPVSEVILHETVTRDVKTTVRVLQKRRLGVHFIIGPDGTVTQHADPALARLEHAAPHNVRSVGIEIVNPVEVRFMKLGLPWDSYINAPWAVGRRYVLPRWPQVEAAAQLIAWLTTGDKHGLRIPRRWTNLRDGCFHMGRVAGADAPQPGLYAHSSFHHSDGSWPLLYAYLRLERGLTVEQAYSLATSLGQQAAPRIHMAPGNKRATDSPSVA
jgi:hypothetical protein